MILIAATLLFAYLLGSIPSAVWVGKIFFNTDVREHGSGNAGATNTFRVLGWKPGLIVFIIDGIKGFFAVYLVSLIPGIPADYMTYCLIGCGLAAVVGHIYPVFAQFNGGKGVATMLGIILALQPTAALISLAVFIVVLLLSSYVSLGSIIAGATYALICIFAIPVIHQAMQIFAVILLLMLIASHKKNIERLFKGEENKIKLSGKKH